MFSLSAAVMYVCRPLQGGSVLFCSVQSTVRVNFLFMFNMVGVVYGWSLVFSRRWWKSKANRF